MNITKIKVIAYAISERIKGNRLLKNPKGIPATTVSVLSHSEAICPFTLDKSSTFVITTKDFLQAKPKTLRKFLFTNEYANYNKITKKLEYQKHVDFASFDTKKLISNGEKGRPDFDKLKKRDLSYVNKVVYRKKETYPDFTFAFLGIAFPKQTTVERTLADIQIDKFYNRKKTPYKRNFFKTLWKNLNQS